MLLVWKFSKIGGVSHHKNTACQSCMHTVVDRGPVARHPLCSSEPPSSIRNFLSEFHPNPLTPSMTAHSPSATRLAHGRQVLLPRSVTAVIQPYKKACVW